MRFYIFRNIYVVFTVIVSLTSFSSFAGSILKISTGYDVTTGSYDQTTDTKIETFPVIIGYIDNAWSYKLTIPYVRVSGDGTVVPGTKGSRSRFFSSAVPSTTTVTNSGLGDITARVGYGFFPANAFFEISSKVKFATADSSKNLGTGENDFYFQLDGVIGRGAFLPFFTLGYLITGDTTSIKYKDVPYATLGAMYKVSKKAGFGIAYDYRQSSSAGISDIKQGSLFVNWKNSSRWSTSLSILRGYTNSAPDTGFNIALTRSYY